jgi:hypothetical protein
MIRPKAVKITSTFSNCEKTGRNALIRLKRFLDFIAVFVGYFVITQGFGRLDLGGTPGARPHF